MRNLPRISLLAALSVAFVCSICPVAFSAPDESSARTVSNDRREQRDAKGPEYVFIGNSISRYWEGANQGKRNVAAKEDPWKMLWGAHSVMTLKVDGNATEEVYRRIKKGALDGISPRVIVVNVGNAKALVALIRKKQPQAKILSSSSSSDAKKSYWAGKEISQELAKIDPAYKEGLGEVLLDIPTQDRETLKESAWISLKPGVEKKLRERILSPGHISDVSPAEIKFIFPKGWNPSDQRSVLCAFPGGAYALLAIEKEGETIARWAAARGMVGVVLKYDVATNHPEVSNFPGPLLSAQKTVRLLRSAYPQLGIDPERIGIIGFSAGGNLAGMTATLFNQNFETYPALKNQISARPDFAMLIYPVITMDLDVTHRGTRSQILGRNFTPELEKLCSVEKQVTGKTPPIFMAQSEDDGVSCKNSEYMEKACRAKNVPVKRVLYDVGGHGYGMEKRGKPTDAWPEEAEKWLRASGFLK